MGAWLPKTPRGGGGKGPLPEGRLFAEELLLAGEAGLCLDPGEFEASAKNTSQLMKDNKGIFKTSAKIMGNCSHTWCDRVCGMEKLNPHLHKQFTLDVSLDCNNKCVSIQY